METVSVPKEAVKAAEMAAAGCGNCGRLSRRWGKMAFDCFDGGGNGRRVSITQGEIADCL